MSDNTVLNDAVQTLAKQLEAEGKQVLIVAVTLEAVAYKGYQSTVAYKGYQSIVNPAEMAALGVGLHHQMADILTHAAERV